MHGAPQTGELAAKLLSYLLQQQQQQSAVPAPQSPAPHHLQQRGALAEIRL
jgi:hypothetical protein